MLSEAWRTVCALLLALAMFLLAWPLLGLYLVAIGLMRLDQRSDTSVADGLGLIAYSAAAWLAVHLVLF